MMIFEKLLTTFPSICFFLTLTKAISFRQSTKDPTPATIATARSTADPSIHAIVKLKVVIKFSYVKKLFKRKTLLTNSPFVRCAG